MTFAEMKGQLSKLSREERQELYTALQSLEEASTPEYKRKMAAIIDDKRPESWVTADELDARLKVLDAKKRKK
jgi:hypothetical protein